MKFLMINIGVGLVQALALTLAAPLLLGIVFRLARIGRSGPADGLLFLYGRLGAARFHDLSLGPTAEFVCVFLAASMLPGFLGAKITFGDFTLLTALLAKYALHVLDHIKYISLGNLILDKLAFRELIQFDFTAEEAGKEIRRLIEDVPYRQRMLDDYARIREELGGSGASQAVAKAMISLI